MRTGGRIALLVRCMSIECGVCDVGCWAETDLTIRGTSFGPVLGGIILAYHNAHVLERDMQTLLAKLENVHISAGAISRCVAAIADHPNAPLIRLSYDAPIVMDDATLREYRLPIRPHAYGSSEYDVQEAKPDQIFQCLAIVDAPAFHGADSGPPQICG